MSYGMFHCVLLYTSIYVRACVCVTLAGAGGGRSSGAGWDPPVTRIGWDPIC